MSTQTAKANWSANNVPGGFREGGGGTKGRRGLLEGRLEEGLLKEA